MIISKDSVFVIGQMEDNIRDSGKMVNNMEKEYILTLKVNLKKENGQKVNKYSFQSRTPK